MSRLKTRPASSEKDDQDRLLLESVASGDRKALEKLYNEFYPRLFKFLFRLSHSYSTTEELVNDVMLAVWRSASSFRGDSKPSTWIFGIAYRLCLKRLARKSLQTSDVELDKLANRREEDIECEDWVRSGLSALPVAQRVTVELVFYLGLSYEEVSQVTDCPVNTVKTRMFHARRKLKDCLELEAFGPRTDGDERD